MNLEKVCNDGRCKRVRMGEEIHLQHLNDNESKHDENLKQLDKDEIFRSPKKIQVLFYCLVVLGGILSYLTTTDILPVMQNPILQIITSTMGFILIGLAFALFNKVDSVKTIDQIDRIESKMDKILKHLEQSQNK